MGHASANCSPSIIITVPIASNCFVSNIAIKTYIPVSLLSNSTNVPSSDYLQFIQLFTINQSSAFAVKEDSQVFSAYHPSHWLILAHALVVPIYMDALLPNLPNILMLDLKMGVTSSIKIGSSSS